MYESLKHDERALIDLVTDRLTMGQKGYGELNIDEDKRDFCTESLEELIDGLIYLAIRLIQLERREAKETDTVR